MKIMIIQIHMVIKFKIKVLVSLGFDYSKNTNLNFGFEYSNLRGHSASKQNNFVTENIGIFKI